MPRADYAANYFTHAGDSTIFPEVLHAVVLTDGVTTYRYATQAVTFRLSAYTSRLKRISSVTSALNQGLQKVTVVLQNADLFEASQLPISGYEGFSVTVYKIIRDSSFSGLDYLTLFTGVVTGFRGDEAYLEIDAVTSVNRAGNISNRRVGVKCPWVFKDSNCGYVGVETTCNKLYTDTGGCSGRSNQHKFGGFPARPAADPKTLSGGGAPPAYQLVKDGSSTYKQQTYLEFTGGATITNNDGALKTTIDLSGIAGIRVVDVTAHGAVGDDSTDNTAALASALTEANSTSKPLYFPPGTYQLDNLYIGNLNSIRIFGAGPGRSILKSRGASASIIDIDADAASGHSFTIEELGFYGYGSGANNDGIEVRDSSSNGVANITLRNLRFNNCGNNAIRMTSAAFTILLEGIDVSMPAGANHAIDINGSNDLTLVRCYVHAVATNKAAYRIHSGTPTLIGCNGIDSGTTADWGVFGNESGEDGVDNYVRATLIGCNIETFSNIGIRCKSGSTANFIGCSFIAPGTGTVKAIKFDYVDSNLAGIFDAASSIITQGASWSNGYAVHSSGLPFIQVGNRELTSYYDTNVGGATTIPGIIGNLITGTSDYALTLDGYTKLTKPLLLPEQSAPATPPANNGWLYTKDTSGTTGLYFKNDAGTETQIDVAPAPSLTSTYVAFGSGSNLVTGNSTLTWDDASKILTVSKAGGNPYVFVTDTTNTIDVRLGTLAGAPDRGIVGTMTNDPFVIYQHGSEAWGVDTSKHMRPYNGNGTQDIGTSSAKARTAYFSTSIDIGNDSVTSGQIVLRNSTNANALTLQAGATGSAYTFKLPTTGGTNGYYLQTDGTGTTSWAAVSAGANTTLSNLASVAINTALLPTADNTIDLGSEAKSFRDTFNDRDIYIGRRLQSSLGTAPTTSAGTGAGTTPTITVSGNDICGAILLTTGTSPATSAKIVDVTFSVNFNNPAGTSNSGYPVVILQPANAAAAALSGNKQVYVNDAANTPALFQLKSGSTALDGATDYVWYYHVIGASLS